jgi:hypothetical protein
MARSTLVEAVMNSESGNRDSDREFEVVGCSPKRQCRGLGVPGAGLLAHPERREEHEHEITVNSSSTSVMGLIFHNEVRFVPRLTLGPHEREAGDDAGQEGNAEVDKSTWKTELNATRPAAYSRSPRAKSFQTITIAMQRANQ